MHDSSSAGRRNGESGEGRIGTVIGSSQEIGMNAEFHAPIGMGAFQDLALMGDEDRRPDRKPRGDLQKSLDAVFRRPIDIGREHEIHGFPSYPPPVKF